MLDPASPSAIRRQAAIALRHAFVTSSPSIVLDPRGYAGSFQQNLLPGVLADDFEADLKRGDGNELDGKFRAAHSSSALAVNCFGPFRRRIGDLSLLGMRAFETIAFERKCHTGIRGGRHPNLDAVAEGPEVVAIESKLTEYLGPHPAKFTDAYREQIRDGRRDGAWFAEMLRLTEAPDSYQLVDAAQLIKHAFGLANCFRDRPVALLYLFWEPANAADHPIFTAHRREIAEFADRVAAATPGFAAMSYPELWASWEADAPAWLAEHLAHLRGRYAVTI